MTDYIKREDALWLAKGGCHWANVAKEIEKLPPADVAPVVHGEWEEVGDGKAVKCTACQVYMTYKPVNWNYCPNCGAKTR